MKDKSSLISFFSWLFSIQASFLFFSPSPLSAEEPIALPAILQHTPVQEPAEEETSEPEGVPPFASPENPLRSLDPGGETSVQSLEVSGITKNNADFKVKIDGAGTGDEVWIKAEEVLSGLDASEPQQIEIPLAEAAWGQDIYVGSTAALKMQTGYSYYVSVRRGTEIAAQSGEASFFTLGEIRGVNAEAGQTIAKLMINLSIYDMNPLHSISDAESVQVFYKDKASAAEWLKVEAVFVERERIWIAEIAPLQPGRLYEFIVKAFNTGKQTAESGIMEFMTQKDPRPRETSAS